MVTASLELQPLGPQAAVTDALELQPLGPRSAVTDALELQPLSPRATVTESLELQLLSPRAAVTRARAPAPVLCNKRRCHSESPAPRDGRAAPLSTAREKPVQL